MIVWLSYLFRFLSLENRVTSCSTSSEKRLSCKLIYLRNCAQIRHTRKLLTLRIKFIKSSMKPRLPCCCTAATVSTRRTLTINYLRMHRACVRLLLPVWLLRRRTFLNREAILMRNFTRGSIVSLFTCFIWEINISFTF